MTKDAVGDAAGLAVSDIELEMGGPSYTSVTLNALSERYPETEWLIIVGADAAAGLDTWHDVDKLKTQADVVVVNRPGADFQPPTGWSWETGGDSGRQYLGDRHSSEGGPKGTPFAS